MRLFEKARNFFKEDNSHFELPAKSVLEGLEKDATQSDVIRHIAKYYVDKDLHTSILKLISDLIFEVNKLKHGKK